MTVDAVIVVIVAVDAVVIKVERTPIVAVLIVAELVKNCVVERTVGIDERYPADPNPLTVEFRFDVLIPPPGPNAVEKEEKL